MEKQNDDYRDYVLMRKAVLHRGLRCILPFGVFDHIHAKYWIDVRGLPLGTHKAAGMYSGIHQVPAALNRLTDERVRRWQP